MKFDRKLVGKICSRSSLSARSIEFGAGVADNSYRGIIYVVLHNLSCEEEPLTFEIKSLKLYLKKFPYKF